jgi:hypothetical protein
MVTNEAYAMTMGCILPLNAKEYTREAFAMTMGQF